MHSNMREDGLWRSPDNDVTGPNSASLLWFIPADSDLLKYSMPRADYQIIFSWASRKTYHTSKEIAFGYYHSKRNRIFKKTFLNWHFDFQGQTSG